MKLEDFEMVRTLGVGSFGRVKYAKYKKDGSMCAVKFMKKAEIVKLKQVDHINQERDLMAKLDHPLIVCMLGSFKDDRYVYIVMETITGGELFTHLRRERKFTNEQACFFSANVAKCFEYMHGVNMVHRDLKPENVLVMTNGYGKLTDFGFAKVFLSHTPEYIAPEVLLNKGHGKPVDWWTHGILTYEMIVGQPPFVDEDPMGIYQRVLAGKIFFTKYMDLEARSLIKKLVIADVSKRYGALKAGPNDVLDHVWYKDLDYAKMLKYELPAPFKPPMKEGDEVSNFDTYDDSVELPPVIKGDMDPFNFW